MLRYDRPGQHHEIKTAVSGHLFTERLTHQSLDSITIHGSTQLFLGDRQAKAGSIRLRVARTSQHSEAGVRRLQRLIENPAKIASVE